MKQSMDDYKQMRDDIAKAINCAAYRYVDNRFQVAGEEVSTDELWEELAPEEKHMRYLQADAAIFIMSRYGTTERLYKIIAKQLTGERNE